MTHLALALLASSTESKKSGPIGFAVILILCVACYFLFKSMSKHMRKVREEFPGTTDAQSEPDVQPKPPAESDEPETVTHPADPPSSDAAD